VKRIFRGPPDAFMLGVLYVAARDTAAGMPATAVGGHRTGTTHDSAHRSLHGPTGVAQPADVTTGLRSGTDRRDRDCVIPPRVMLANGATQAVRMRRAA
jgi:hypothetical protein